MNDRRMNDNMNYAILLSGGIGTRMQISKYPKQYLQVNEKPILVYTLEKFQNCKAVDSIVIVASEEWQDQIKKWIDDYNISKFCGFAEPGEQRQESIKNGLNACLKFECSNNDIVIIHDAARPLVSDNLICKCIQFAIEYGGCMPVLPVTDTIYQSIDGSSIDGLLNRNTLYAGQSPEAFKLVDYAKLNNSISVDELNMYKGTSEIAFKYGMNIHLIEGEESNFKLTTPKDLEKFQKICGEQ